MTPGPGCCRAPRQGRCPGGGELDAEGSKSPFLLLHLYIYMYICICMYAYVHVYDACVYTSYIYIHMCVCVSVYVVVNVCTHFYGAVLKSHTARGVM